jgi:hypothetical protein
MWFYRSICGIQGVYFLATGIWPLISIQTFQAVTGQKTDHLVTGREADHWLVNTVGVLVIAIGLVLVFAAWRGVFSAEALILGVSSAVGLAGIDVVYCHRGTISAVYLVDAALEFVFITTWVACAWQCRRVPYS